MCIYDMPYRMCVCACVCVCVCVCVARGDKGIQALSRKGVGPITGLKTKLPKHRRRQVWQ